MGFFRVSTEYLTEKRVKCYFWIDLLLGAAALGAAMQLYGTKWSVMLAVVSVLCLIDCYMLRYFFEIKRAIQRT